MFGYPPKRDEKQSNNENLDFNGIHFRRKPHTNLYVPEYYTYSRYRQKLKQFRQRKIVPEIKVRRDWIPIVFSIVGIVVVGVYTVYARLQWIASNDMVGKIQDQIRVGRDANTIARNTSTSSIKLATDALHVTERAYIVTDGPTLDPGTKFVSIDVSNVGHLPSPDIAIIGHEATINMQIANSTPIVANAVESHWKATNGPAPPGEKVITLAIPVPAFSESQFRPDGAYQAIFIAGRIGYRDGFPDDPAQEWNFCFQSVYHLVLKKLFWVACDPSVILPQMEKIDGFPDPKTEQQ